MNIQELKPFRIHRGRQEILAKDGSVICSLYFGGIGGSKDKTTQAEKDEFVKYVVDKLNDKPAPVTQWLIPNKYLYYMIGVLLVLCIGLCIYWSINPIKLF